MKRIQFPACVLVILASSMAASKAFAVEWLVDGGKLTAALAVEQSGELNLINTNASGVGIRVEILCEGILDGTVGPASTGEITELLNTAKEAISLTALSGLALEMPNCANTKNCTEPLVWAVGLPWKTDLPWKTELESM